MATSLPPLAPFPPSNIRLTLAPAEWEACLDAWLTLTDLYLRLPAGPFGELAGDDNSLHPFLPSFYREVATLSPSDHTLSSSKALSLRKLCFSLVERVASESKAPAWLVNLEFLADFCRAHIRSLHALGRVLGSIWQHRRADLESILSKRKDAMIKVLDSSQPISASRPLSELAPIIRTSPDAGAYFATGSDLLDSLADAYVRLPESGARKGLSGFTYLSLIALVKLERPLFSTLSDSLYSLKSQADKVKTFPSLLADLTTNTPLLVKLRLAADGKVADRLIKLLDQLESYRMPSIARPRKALVSKKLNKGKGKASGVDHDFHVHRMSLVTQIQDLFPDLGSGFIFKLLDEYGDNVEQVTAHLLDDSLPPHLQSLDRTEQAPLSDTDAPEDVEHLAPRPTPPLEPFVPDRRNVFDDDDILAADTSRLHIGKAERTQSGQPNKAAILSALAAFDSDDDERDDTYDVDDVGGTIDSAHPDGEPGPNARVTQEENDMALFSTYRSSPELFGRTFDIRKGQARQAIKRDTGMTDEAIEGWAIMLQRDPQRLQRLERQFGERAFSGQQTELPSTAYRAPAGGTTDDDSDAPQQGSGSRGGGGRGRGAVVAGEGAAAAAQAWTDRLASRARPPHRGGRKRTKAAERTTIDGINGPGKWREEVCRGERSGPDYVP
ncbi:CUE domain [Teratosphaeria destructans]|uniref:CUE domain n=1 Tax=Teratosphaeria destructans TaxID=418781 RepID=A0A9W7SKI3_9PEZI|nr:CUE domain [Teratosphaeria destructans]